MILQMFDEREVQNQTQQPHLRPFGDGETVHVVVGIGPDEFQCAYRTRGARSYTFIAPPCVRGTQWKGPNIGTMGGYLPSVRDAPVVAGASGAALIGRASHPKRQRSSHT
jgi:hypothetical protein